MLIADPKSLSVPVEEHFRKKSRVSQPVPLATSRVEKRVEKPVGCNSMSSQAHGFDMNYKREA